MIENTILSNLVFNEKYVRRVIAYLKSEYFSGEYKIIFELIHDYINKYNTPPTLETLRIDLDEKRLDQKQWELSCKLISSLKLDENADLDWIVDKSEAFCKDQATVNALRLSMNILDGSEKRFDRGMVPAIMTEALAVSFDTAVGHDYLDDWEKRFNSYHRVENKIPFDLDIFNKITNGGVEPKTLTMFLAGPHVGKTLMKCHLAGNNLYMGKNVLFITNEMEEEKLAKRIDCNLLDISIDDIDTYSRETYSKRIERVKGQTRGKLIFKEYPTTVGSVANFRHLLNELRLKRNFKPDIIYVDYLNNMASSRIKRGATNMYEYIKAVGEELRGLAVEFKVPIITSTQVNRSGFKSSNLDMDDVAESFGSAFTADAIFALSAPEEMIDAGQILVKQLKNRFGDVHRNTRFVLGVDYSRFKLSDVREDGQPAPEPRKEEKSDRYAMLN